MKKIILIAAIALFLGCNKKEEKKHPHDHSHTMESEAVYKDPKNPLNKLTYASNLDFSCNMDISKYGVSDTVTYKGKLYGFCSGVCKEDFVKNADEYLAKNKK
ncbi:YHS domain-containing protein [Flavobacterium anhuiense]|uniref:YHS domain-containing protein n=1 Tax=Flavobacterium anhuiense TaxID=459526 RepID=A0ABY0LX79_9FLAO|nr:YHS domain-containing protein [Flavobacterium anhuiense]SCY75584.1 YHS domain-containing protein [Flavobacterium anhuiense]